MKDKREQELETINELADGDYDVGEYPAVLQLLEEHFLGDDFEDYVFSQLDSADEKIVSFDSEQLEEVSDLMLSQYTKELIS